jgi:predicted GNAT family acetyltransferase
MAPVVECDPKEVLARAGDWLETEPVLHNVVCSVLQRAVAHPEGFRDARWFVVEERGDPVGVAILTPPFPLGLTLIPDEPLAVLAGALAPILPGLAGVSGPVDVAARFAQRWRERTGAEIHPGMEQLIYRLDTVVPPPRVEGRLRRAAAPDHELLCEWFSAFCVEAGAVAGNIPWAVERRTAQGELWLWEHGSPVTMVGVVPAVAGVVRVGPVYTPPALRRRGYAASAVGAVSQSALDAGATACMLFTDAANPTSNSIYQRIGYRMVTTAAEYGFRYPEPVSA